MLGRKSRIERKPKNDQLNIFDVVGFSNDPVYTEIQKLKKDEETSIGGFHIYRNSIGWYEIENEEMHELKKDFEDCYRYLDSLINPIHKGIFF
jgi:hypothetical protein